MVSVDAMQCNAMRFSSVVIKLFYIRFLVVAAAAAQNASDIIQNQVVNEHGLSMNMADAMGMVNPQIVNVQPTTTAASAAAANLSPAQQSLLNNIQ